MSSVGVNSEKRTDKKELCSSINVPTTFDEFMNKTIHLEDLTAQSPAVHLSKVEDMLRDPIDFFVWYPSFLK